MILIWGQKLYGKCERVPGEFYVATKFFHLWYIPLIPLGSWVVLEGSEVDDGWSGTSTPLSWRSVLMGYARAAFVLMAIGGVIGTFLSWSHGPAAFAPPLGAGVVGLALFGATKIFDKAGRESTLERARDLGLSEQDAVSFADGKHDVEVPHGAGRHTPTGG